MKLHLKYVLPCLALLPFVLFYALLLNDAIPLEMLITGLWSADKHIIRELPPYALHDPNCRSMYVTTNSTNSQAGLRPDHSYNGTSVIPKLIHRLWKTEHIPEDYADLYQSWNDCLGNKNYKFMLWTDAKLRAFMVESYPQYVELYDSYDLLIQRLDVIRYFILHKYGGIYIDIDIGCPYNSTLRGRIPYGIDNLRYLGDNLDATHGDMPTAVFIKTSPMGVTNDFMAATPRHPVFKRIIGGLVAQKKHKVLNFVGPHFKVMMVAGPTYVSKQIYFHIQNLNRDPREWARRATVFFMPIGMAGRGSLPLECPYFIFRVFNSWKSAEQKYFTVHFNAIMIVISIIAAGSIFIIWKCCCVSHTSSPARFHLKL